MGSLTLPKIWLKNSLTHNHLNRNKMVLVILQIIIKIRHLLPIIRMMTTMMMRKKGQFSVKDVTRTSMHIVNLPIIYGLEPCAGQSIVNKKKIENDHASIETVMIKETNQNIGL